VEVGRFEVASRPVAGRAVANVVFTMALCGAPALDAMLGLGVDTAGITNRVMLCGGVSRSSCP
jgi:hypothetical protein